MLSNLLFSPMFTLARKLGGQAADDEGSPDNPFSQAAMAAHGVHLDGRVVEPGNPGRGLAEGRGLTGGLD